MLRRSSRMTQASMAGYIRITREARSSLTVPAGDDELKVEYEARVASFDPISYWQFHEHDLQVITERNREVFQEENKRDVHHAGNSELVRLPDQTTDSRESDGMRTCMEVDGKPEDCEPFNPYEGDKMAKQLDETVDNFLGRCRPSTTTVSSGPWIWVANPMSGIIPARHDIAAFKTEGNDLLEEYTNRKARLEEKHPGKSAGTITKMLKADREWLEKSIHNLARKKDVQGGKWMLFPYSNTVDEAWQKVVKGTVDGVLGFAAKVATDDGSSPQRVICVYTEDCEDMDDVKRVLRKMQELRLIKAEQGIYYKCDAYTYLDIMSGNDYKLKASMYASKDLQKEMANAKR